jgi:hypothetical protein
MVPIQTGGVNPYLLNTAGGSFTAQRQGGTIIGLSAATTKITKAILVKDVNAGDMTIYPLPKLLSGARTYNTAKILSAGTFAYNSNSGRIRTYIMSRLTTSLAGGVANTFLQFMGNVGIAPSIAYYVQDNFNNVTSAIRTNLFSRTGYGSTGTGYVGKIKARTTWNTTITATAGSDFGSVASQPTRAIPGRLVFLTNFVNYLPATSSNFYSYKPITGR